MQNENISNETRLTRIQALVVEILNDLLRAPIDETDASIEQAIARLGDYCVRDRAYVFVHEGDNTSNTHEWCANGIDPAIDQLQGLPIEMYGPIAESLDLGEHFHVPDVSELPEGIPSREILESQGIKSILLVPMRWEGATYGFVGFDGVRNTHAFLPGEVYLLQSVADVICSVLVRRERDHAARAAQADLANERAFLASILSTSAMGILVLDHAGIVRFANDAAETVLGATRAQMIGVAHDDARWAYTREDGVPYATGETPFDDVVKSSRPVVGHRFALHCPDGLRYCSVHAAPVTGAEGGDARVVYALLDVTNQVAAERERQEALADAQRANAAKSNFLAKMSHEMRTPLNGVLGVAEVLEQLINDPDQQRMVKVMHDSGALLLNIINDLLDMSKIEADQMVIEVVPFVPAEIAQRVESVHTLKASEKQLSLGVTILGDGQYLRLGDPHRVLQILHNVISNAVKFTEAGSVSVSFDCQRVDRMLITIADTGIGMTEAQKVYVFEEFGQADSSIARRFGGTGLGMPIVRRLVEMMHGTIELTSALGAGTVVSIDLPIPQTDAAEIIVPEVSDAEDYCDIRGLRVLAADDNRTNRMILGAMMGQLGIAAVLVSDGSEALTAYEKEDFDLVILDISMPTIDGVTVLREIRTREAQRATTPGGRVPATLLPIIAFTANAMSHQVDGYLKAGFDDCLTKPLQLDRLRSALGKLILERGRRRTGGVVPLRASSAH
ncbi:ATP-binding protein [Pararhodobacter sp.]|uniref:ATP-binding protein n=1 Tax=Pararhodobacter sp. TaxID=2127056 RepID=UPI002AFE9A3E|nr:ATP-binding protein [Pararhodobacter sp.]